MPRIDLPTGTRFHSVLLVTLAVLLFVGTPAQARGQEPGSVPANPPQGAGAALGPAELLTPRAQEREGLRPGDRVVISIFTAAGEALQEIQGPRIVDRRGQIYLPFIGDVRVAGMDDSEVREHLEERFSDFFTNPVVDVRIELRVNVTGAVRQPGNFFLDPMSTLVDALAHAGGVSSEVTFQGGGVAADMQRVRLVREGTTRILDLRPEQVDQDVLSLPVRSGDWLHVPPQTRSLLRDNIQLISAGLSVVATIVGVTVLIVD